MGLCASCDIDTYPHHDRYYGGSHCDDPCDFNHQRHRVECCDKTKCGTETTYHGYPNYISTRQPYYTSPPAYNPDS